MKNDTAIGLPQNLLFHTARPYWTNRDDNSWQLVTDTLVVLAVLSVPTAVIILYGVAVKNRWAVNSAFMVLYVFACVLVCWVCCVKKAVLGYFSNAIVVSFKFDFGAITLILIAWALLGRMSFYGWMLFVLLWLTFWYPIGASGIWPVFVHGSLSMAGIIDYPGGYVIYFSSGVAGFTAACWVWKNILSQPIFLAVCC